jgi:tetratricopeptide (TPR) repeat protein
MSTSSGVSTLFDLAEPKTAKAMQHYLLGEWEQARKLLEESLRQHPENHFISYLLGEISYASGKLEKAVAYYRRAIEMKPDFGVAHYKMGTCLYRMGRLDESLREFGALITLPGQGHAMGSYFVGLINQMLGDNAAAERGFEVLKDESPESLIANYYLAQLKILQHRYTEALQLLDELLRVSPALAEVHYLEGVAHQGLHQNMDAAACYRRTLEINPGDLRARASLDLLTNIGEP